MRFESVIKHHLSTILHSYLTLELLPEQRRKSQVGNNERLVCFIAESSRHAGPLIESPNGNDAIQRFEGVGRSDVCPNSALRCLTDKLVARYPK